jgi:hypothetical protein
MLFGAVGGVFAAPFLKIVVDARIKLKAAGLFSNGRGAAADGPAPAGPAATRGAGPPGGAGAGPSGPLALDPALAEGQGDT